MPVLDPLDPGPEHLPGLDGSDVLTPLIFAGMGLAVGLVLGVVIGLAIGWGVWS